MLVHTQTLFFCELQCPANRELTEQFGNLFLEMVTISPPFVLFVPEKFDDNMAQEFGFCNQKQPHGLHVRRPVVLINYIGKPCVKGLVCKGYVDITNINVS